MAPTGMHTDPSKIAIPPRTASYWRVNGGWFIQSLPYFLGLLSLTDDEVRLRPGTIRGFRPSGVTRPELPAVEPKFPIGRNQQLLTDGKGVATAIAIVISRSVPASPL